MKKRYRRILALAVCAAIPPPNTVNGSCVSGRINGVKKSPERSLYFRAASAARISFSFRRRKRVPRPYPAGNEMQNRGCRRYIMRLSSPDSI